MPDGSLQLPFVVYAPVIHNFEEDLYDFCEKHPEFDHTRYYDTLKEHGIEWDAKSMSEVDVNEADEKLIIALLIGALRAERFCDGILLRFLKNGSIFRWLEILKVLDK